MPELQFSLKPKLFLTATKLMSYLMQMKSSSFLVTPRSLRWFVVPLVFVRMIFLLYVFPISKSYNRVMHVVIVESNQQKVDNKE